MPTYRLDQFNRNIRQQFNFTAPGRNTRSSRPAQPTGTYAPRPPVAKTPRPAQSWTVNAAQNANVGYSQATGNWFNQATRNAGQAHRLACLCEARVIDPGDFNDDGLVDAADYVVWRKTLGDTVDRGYFADGDGDGAITPDDYEVWRANFGTNYLAAGSANSAPTSVPEPPTFVAALLALLGVTHRTAKGTTPQVWSCRGSRAAR